MIQILTIPTSIRPTTSFKNKWRVESLQDLFLNYERHIAKIAEGERYNIYFTVSHCLEEEGRRMVSRSAINFDIDHCDYTRLAEYADPICECLDIRFADTPFVASGHGIQFFIGLKTPITDPEYFSNTRKHYKVLCDKIALALKAKGLPGSIDTSVWDAARLMRMPGTWNRKEGKAQVMATIMQRNMAYIDYDIVELAKLPDTSDATYIPKEYLKKFPPPDTQGVLNGCNFLKNQKEHPNEHAEPLWYAALTVLHKLKDGRGLCHEYSRGHHKYTPEETDQKIEYATHQSPGPRTCEHINILWGKCAECPHYGKVKSPIMIRSLNYIATRDTGFRAQGSDANGNTTTGKIVLEDLRRFLEEQHEYFNIFNGKGTSTFIWNSTHWREIFEPDLNSFLQEHVAMPTPKRADCTEFVALVQRTNKHDAKWMQESIIGHFNFKNGILNIQTGEFFNHSPEYGFISTLPYNYDPTALAPRFVQFMKEITANDQELEYMLLEYLGYVVAGHSNKGAKTLLCVGEGANGKSTLMNVLKAIVGSGNYSSVFLKHTSNMNALGLLERKLVNISEETASDSLLDASLFKLLADGGEILVKKLYKDVHSFRGNCKLICLCNESPIINEHNVSMWRRFIIAPFKVRFDFTANLNIEELLIAELSGIFNILAEGYKRFLNNKERFTNCEAANRELQLLKENNDVYDFLDENIIIHPMPEDLHEKFLSFGTIYATYKHWCMVNGYRNRSAKAFSILFRKLFPKEEEKRFKHKNERKKTIRGVYGIEWSEDADIKMPNEIF